MDTIITGLIDFLTPLGSTGLFLAMVLSCVIESFGVPMVPDVIYNFIFMTDPTLLWGFILPFGVVLGESIGMVILYILAGHFELPERVKKVMRAWTDFLLIHDERLLIVHRIFPVLMFTGVFVRVLDNWTLPRALFWNGLACYVKYLLLSFLYLFLSATMETKDAQNMSFLLTILIMVIFAILSIWKKMRDGLDPKQIYRDWKAKRANKKAENVEEEE